MGVIGYLPPLNKPGDTSNYKWHEFPKGMDEETIKVLRHTATGSSAQDAAIRESKEELDIDITPQNIKCVHIMSNLASRTESFDFFFEVSKFSGQIRNCEGDKCADMQYFTIDEIKKLKNVVSTTRISLENIAKGHIYSECKSYKSATR